MALPSCQEFLNSLHLADAGELQSLVDQSESCHICAMDFQRISISPIHAVVRLHSPLPHLGHFYHDSCVRPWLQDHQTCPDCRMPLFRGLEEEQEDEDEEMNLDSDDEAEQHEGNLLQELVSVLDRRERHRRQRRFGVTQRNGWSLRQIAIERSNIHRRTRALIPEPLDLNQRPEYQSDLHPLPNYFYSTAFQLDNRRLAQLGDRLEEAYWTRVHRALTEVVEQVTEETTLTSLAHARAELHPLAGTAFLALRHKLGAIGRRHNLIKLTGLLTALQDSITGNELLGILTDRAEWGELPAGFEILVEDLIDEVMATAIEHTPRMRCISGEDDGPCGQFRILNGRKPCAHLEEWYERREVVEL
jgi:hypothetical protein